MLLSLQRELPQADRSGDNGHCRCWGGEIEGSRKVWLEERQMMGKMEKSPGCRAGLGETADGGQEWSKWDAMRWDVRPVGCHHQSHIRKTWNCWRGSRASHKDIQRAGAPLLRRQA